MGPCSRVKLYRLGATGTWEDRGTGSATLEWLERSATYGLIVVSEDEAASSGDPLLVHRVRAQEDLYQLHSGSILSWEVRELWVWVCLFGWFFFSVSIGMVVDNRFHMGMQREWVDWFAIYFRIASFFFFR